MTVTVDARGLACPQPVILTRNAMRSADQVITLVSDADQVDNVRRLAERAGWVTAVTEDEQGLAIHMIKAPAAGHQSEPAVTHENSMGQAGRHVLVLTGEATAHDAAISDQPPHFVMESIEELGRRLAESRQA